MIKFNKDIYLNYYLREWCMGYDNIYIYSDPHFNEADDQRKKYIGNDEQVKRINSVCHKKDILIILGDIGDPHFISKLNAGYKVLIKGNHDAGDSNYERDTHAEEFKFMLNDEQKAEIQKIEDSWQPIDSTGYWVSMNREIAAYTDNLMFEDFKKNHANEYLSIARKSDGSIVTHYNSKEDCWYYVCSYDNKLFDEVYDSVLPLNDKIILSHEPIKITPAINTEQFMFNFHGHDHSNLQVKDKYHFNCCAEHIDYKPIKLADYIKNGKLKHIESIHRMVIDRATERKNKREAK